MPVPATVSEVVPPCARTVVGTAAGAVVGGVCDTALVATATPAHRSVAALVDRLTGVPGREDRLRHLEVLPPRTARFADWPALGPGRRPGGLRRGGDHPALAAPGRRRRRRPRRSPRRPGDRDGVGQVAGLPAARAGRDPCLARRPGRAGRRRALPRAHQGARPRPAGHRRRARAGRPRRHPRRRQPPRAAGLDARPRGVRPHQPRHAAPLAAARPRALGVVLRLAASTSWWTSATTTAASSARTWPTCCAGCAGSARCTAPTRPSCWPPRRCPTRTSPPGGSPACPSRRSRPTHSPRGQVSLALWEPPFVSHAGENGAPVRRAASSEVADLLADLVAEDVRTLAFVRSRRGAEQVALTAAELLDEVDPSLPSGWRPTAAATCRRSGAPWSRRCVRGAAPGWPPPTPSSWASTSAGSTRC